MKKRIVNSISRLYKIVFAVMGLILPKDKKMIVFESFLGKQYSDNPRAIFEYLKKQNLGYKMFWSVDKKNIKQFESLNLDIKYIRRFSIGWLLLMTRAKYWVTNSRLPLWIPKPRGTVYVQTWHGT